MTHTTLIQLVETTTQSLQAAIDAGELSLGHGTFEAWDEAAWMVLWSLKLPLDTELDERALSADDVLKAQNLLAQRLQTRKPLAYLTQEAWLQGLPFYVDERVIVPRSLIAEPLVDGRLDDWLSEDKGRVLDLCTGNGSLAILTAVMCLDADVDAADISHDALEVAAINVNKHKVQDRVLLLHSDGLENVRGPYDLILCNPPYVNSDSMAALPKEYQQEPTLSLAGGTDGMDFIRPMLAAAASQLTDGGALVLEIGHERAFFEAAFPHLDPLWLSTSAGDDQVLLLTREQLL
jgi:ribosomal protein L3 glutamine methyltransferase